SYLPAALVHRHGNARRDAAHLWRQPELVVELFGFGPVDFQPNEPALCAEALRFDQRIAADEVFFFELHHASETDLVGVITLRGNERFFAAVVVDVDQDQPSFNSRDVERQHARGMQVKLAADFNQRIPNSDGVLPIYPQFIAKVASVAGARDVERHARDTAVSHAEILKIGNVRAFDDGLQHLPRGRSLQGQSGNLL